MKNKIIDIANQVPIESNIFDHIFYEMIMYENNKRMLTIYHDENVYKGKTVFTSGSIIPNFIMNNSVYVSFVVHMRALLDFFREKSRSNKNNESDFCYDITVSKIITNFSCIPYKQYDDKIKFLERNVLHITDARIKDNAKTQALNEMQTIDEILCVKIKEFIINLPKNINLDYKDDFQITEIQERYETLKEMYM